MDRLAGGVKRSLPPEIEKWLIGQKRKGFDVKSIDDDDPEDE
jgi:hypothetical protein